MAKSNSQKLAALMGNQREVYYGSIEGKILHDSTINFDFLHERKYRLGYHVLQRESKHLVANIYATENRFRTEYHYIFLGKTYDEAVVMLKRLQELRYLPLPEKE